MRFASLYAEYIKAIMERHFYDVFVILSFLIIGKHNCSRFFFCEILNEQKETISAVVM